MSPELYRPVAADRIGTDTLEVTVEANAAECAALAARMQIPALQSLTCQYRLERSVGEGIIARGRLRARVVQTCVVSLDEFESVLDEAFSVRFVPAGQESAQIDPDADDEIPFEGGVLDLGEATAEQLGLALDPYPRKPGVTLPEDTAPEQAAPEQAPHPFAALAARRH